MGKIEWTEKASSHLRDIFYYISKDSKLYAARYIKRLVHATGKLESMPRCGRIVPELDDIRFREVIFGNYRIVYRIVGADNDIEVLAVVHGARDMKTAIPEQWELS